MGSRLEIALEITLVGCWWDTRGAAIFQTRQTPGMPLECPTDPLHAPTDPDRPLACPDRPLACLTLVIVALTLDQMPSAPMRTSLRQTGRGVRQGRAGWVWAFSAMRVTALRLHADARPCTWMQLQGRAR